MRPALSRGSGSSFFRTSHATFSTVVFRDGRSVMPMRGFTRLVLIALIALLILPAAARAQNASIAGVVKDDLRRRASRRDGGSGEPGADREDRDGRHRRCRPIQDHQPPAGHLQVTFTLSGFSTYKREGIEVTGSSDRHRQRRHEGRHARGNDHRDRRNAARRRAERDGAEGRDQGSHRLRFRPAASASTWRRCSPG